ncbi:MAG: N-6 DNA methylase [Pirellulales bacterium]
MSEELLQTIPFQIGKYTYYRLGNTTLAQLRNAGIIPKKNYEKLEAKKPDGLIVYHGRIKAVVEYKQPKDLSSERKINKAIAQELEVAKALSKILIVTDSTKTFWINALNGERIQDMEGNDLETVFHAFAVRNPTLLEYLLDEVDASVSATNSTIRRPRLIDPTPLATRLWQTIWVATGKSPVKCLYNVVELFIFKFLSDLRVLPDDIAFNRIREKAMEDPEEALDFYAKNTRKKIYKLFPAGGDGTTIINGTIFVAENGEANLSQSVLFRRSLDHLHKYAEEFGGLTKIDKQFKTKVYESFLKQEVAALGQYFTPRRIIQSIIRMASLDSPSFRSAGTRICDPFCGVGGFPLEILNMNEGMQCCYTPAADKTISVPFVIHGFDKGFERDDERTIILAKANMLIYLSELVFAYPTCSGEFSRAFNDTFILFKDNLGTFGHIIDQEQEKYDFILSNPPYVTSGSGIIKEEIKRTPRTSTKYPVNALGLEGLSMEWIVRSLKKGGRAFVIVPDGILGRVGGKKLRSHILRECYLDAIVSLPLRTFYANSEHTYIIALTKKHNPDDAQTKPVFTYLVSNIGERLKSVHREEIEEDDLPQMESLYKIFSATGDATRKMLERETGRCKILDIVRFREEPHWVIDRWWTKQELIDAGVEEGTNAAEKPEVDAATKAFNGAVADYDRFISANPLAEMQHRAVLLGDESCFKTFIGKRVLLKDITDDDSNIPLFSANAIQPMGFVEKGNISDFNYPAILWGIDNSLFNYKLIASGEEFATTDHCGAIQILDKSIMPEYLLYALCLLRSEKTFDRSFRSSLSNMRLLSLEIPVKQGGGFDVRAQKSIAKRFTAMQEKQQQLGIAKKRLDDVFSRYLVMGNWH